MAAIDTTKLQVSPENAAKFKEWLATRGGLAIWGCLDFGNLVQTWTTPAKTVEGEPYPKPHWSATTEPTRIITSADEVEVCEDREVKRFRVGVKGDGWGRFAVTDGGTRRIRKEVAKAGTGAYYTFDYDSQEAVIMAPTKVAPLSEWEG